MSAATALAIVNYRTADLTVDRLRSLAREVVALPGRYAVVADNRSEDGFRRSVEAREGRAVPRAASAVAS